MNKKSTSEEATISRFENIRGADLLVRCLEREDVDTVFAYPGGASLELHQALARETSIRTILPRHEQGCGFMAHGYTRTTGKVSVCMTTSGPGATNLITCIADAWMDSIPMIAITGQVKQDFIGKTAFQEIDIYGMTLPVCKHSYMVQNIHDLPRIIKEAFYVATHGRPGPVLIDIPKDIQQEIADVEMTVSMELPGFCKKALASDEELENVLQLISKSKRPTIYAGGGILSSEANEELLAFAELTGIPVVTTLMGLGGFPESHPQSLRWFGMHGCVAGNWASYESDLIIVAGARFDDRVTGDVSKFAPDAKFVHIDIDKSEHHKNVTVAHPIHSDIKYALGRMVELAEENSFSKPDISEWEEKVYGWREEYPFKHDEEHKFITSQEAIKTLYEETKGDAIISTGVGQHQMWAAQFYQYDSPRSFVSSLGLGTMGFGLPAALGAKVALPEKTVVDIDGDGSFTMNVQELATAVRENIPVKVLLLDNQHLGMVVQWEDNFYDSVRGQTVLGDGRPDNIEGLYPNWVQIAEGFGVKSRRVHKKEDLREAMKEMLEHDGPYVLNVIVPHTEHVLPFIPAGGSAKDIILER